MARGFVSTLDECLVALRRGESLEDCLARYPRHAEELRTHLLLAQRLSLTPRHEPRPTTQAAAWERFRVRAEDMRLGRRPSLSINIGWMRPLGIAAVLVLAVLAAGGGTVYASQDALPDSPLYRVKLTSEEVRLWFTFDDTRKADLLLDQSDERTDEIMEMLRSGKTIPGNVLSALRDRNSRAVDILEDKPQERVLLARAHEQSAAQEALLLALWGDLSQSARDDFAEAVATLHNTQLGASAVSNSVAPEDLAAGVINITGPAQPAAEGVWLFGGVEVRLDSRTLGGEELEPGQAVNVIAARGANGRLLALSVTVSDRRQPQQEYVVSGALDEVGDDEVVIAGQRIAITESTLLKLKLLRGQQVEIEVKDDGGQPVASIIEGPTGDVEEEAPALLAYEGVFQEEVSTDEVTNEWVVGGQRFLVTPATEIDARAGDLVEGARARVEAVAEDDEMVAKRVVVLAAVPEEGAVGEGEEDGVAVEKDAVSLEGVFEEGDEGTWTISGVEVEAPPEVETPEVGSLVSLQGRRQKGRLVAERLLAAFHPGSGGLTQLRGRIGGIEDDGSLQVGFARVEMGVNTVVSGEPYVGSRVFIWANRDADDSLQAIFVKILDPKPPAPEPDSQD